mgnify:CR=1 FL=1
MDSEEYKVLKDLHDSWEHEATHLREKPKQVCNTHDIANKLTELEQRFHLVLDKLAGIRGVGKHKIVNYRELLKKYIKHVGENEGVSFIGPHDNWIGIFDDDEWQELLKIDNEMIKEVEKILR